MLDKATSRVESLLDPIDLIVFNGITNTDICPTNQSILGRRLSPPKSANLRQNASDLVLPWATIIPEPGPRRDVFGLSWEVSIIRRFLMCAVPFKIADLDNSDTIPRENNLRDLSMPGG